MKLTNLVLLLCKEIFSSLIFFLFHFPVIFSIKHNLQHPLTLKFNFAKFIQGISKLYFYFPLYNFYKVYNTISTIHQLSILVSRIQSPYLFDSFLQSHWPISLQVVIKIKPKNKAKKIE